MADIRWTLQAADDLEAIINFIAADSDHYARLLAADVLAAVERAACFPHAGRVVPETHTPEIREILLGNYRIIYRIKDTVIEILTVYHSARVLDPTQLQ